MEQINEHDFTGYGEEMIDLVKRVKSQSDEIARLKSETASVAEIPDGHKFFNEFTAKLSIEYPELGSREL